MTAYASLAIGSAAHAAVMVYELPFIGTWDGYSTEDTSLTFSGTGYVGMYADGGSEFAALFGLETSNFSRTHAQVGIGGLTGASISSAILSFDILDGDEAGQQSVQVTGYSGTGALGYQWDAPGVSYGDEIFNVAPGSNALDITGLLAASVGAGDDWFNLHLQGLIDQTYIYTYAGNSYSDDRANVRLTVTYETGQPSTVPAPAPLGLLLVGLAGMGILHRRSR
ncbi:hypothetical protein [Rhodospirillaceae bacterium SYSU D60014]|uniref:hypothetical protein n=1 Tax=Virgifigura deserti TaxID=2268457 RepID=UPI000E66ED70